MQLAVVCQRHSALCFGDSTGLLVGSEVDKHQAFVSTTSDILKCKFFLTLSAMYIEVLNSSVTNINRNEHQYCYPNTLKCCNQFYIYIYAPESISNSRLLNLRTFKNHFNVGLSPMSSNEYSQVVDISNHLLERKNCKTHYNLK